MIDCSHFEAEIKGENGNRIINFSNGDKYDGQIRNGQLSGMGTLIYSDGRKYDGQWKNNRADGRGVCIYKDGSKYDGLWKDGNWNGFGTFINVNGGSTETAWTNGKSPKFEMPDIPDHHISGPCFCSLL